MKNITGFTISQDDLKFCGINLNKPTCIVKLNDQELLCTDTEYGIIKINWKNNTQKPYLQKNQYTPGEQLNSFMLSGPDTILLANMAKGRIEIIKDSQDKQTLFDKVNNKPLGRVNFICSDNKNGFYATVSTNKDLTFEGLSSKVTDGYIVHFTLDTIKLVAKNLKFPNEARIDSKGEYLYVAETAGKCVSRFKILDKGNLGEKELFGPQDFGPGGYPDGIQFDKHGNLWGTLVFGEKIYCLSKGQDLQIIYDASNKSAIKKVDSAFNSNYITPEIGLSAANKINPFIVSVTFAGPDNNLAFIGSYGNKLSYFKCSV